ADRARVLDDRPVSAAARARRRKREPPLRLGDDSAAAALRADGRRRPRLRAGAAADVAGALEAHGQRRLDALQRVLERERDLHLRVRAPLPARLLPPATAAAGPAAEQPAEQVAEVAE